MKVSLTMTEAPEAPPRLSAKEQHSPDLLYTLEETPPWHITFLLGIQHCLTMVSTTIPIPFLLTSMLCLGPSHPMRGYFISTIIFVSGLNTLLQTTVGIRLPIVQGGNFAYMIPSMALLSTQYKTCEAQLSANMTVEEQEDMWQDKIRLIQGSIAASSIFQILIGFTGLIGVLLRWITPLTVLPTIMLVGLSMFDVAASQASSHWGVSIMATVVMIVFSQYLTDVSVPFPRSIKKGCIVTFSWLKIFKLFSVLLALATSWAVCWLLTHYEVLPEGSPARTDTALRLVRESQWFYVPYPGQWGPPRVAVASVIGCMSAGVASIVESVGDYIMCAKVSGASPPPLHAVNRGVMVEGVGVALAGLFGTGSGTNSYSENIASLVLTRVASRRVVQVSAVVMMVLGSFCKFGALWATIPEPVIASLYLVLFSYIVSASLPTILMVNVQSPRNLFILGFTLFFSLAVSKFVKAHPEVINTGLPILDQTLVILLQTTMFLGSTIGCFLDNTVPGSAEDRGLTKWRENLARGQAGAEYDIPGTLACSRKIRWLRYAPFWPTFKGGTLPGNVSQGNSLNTDSISEDGGEAQPTKISDQTVAV